MSDESGRSNDEDAQALAAPYTVEAVRKILKTTHWRSNVSQNEIQRRMRFAALAYAPHGRLLTEKRRPSERERRFQGVHNKVRAAATAVRKLNRLDLDHLEVAGQDLAKDEGGLPDIEPELVVLPLLPGQTEPDQINIWDAARQINATLERLDWLCRFVERAIEQTVQEKAGHGSPVADKALHTTIRILSEIYFAFADDPRTPGTDIGDDSEEDKTWRKSELLDFLEAALRPLGVQKSREAIYSLWRRAALPLKPPTWL